MGGNTARTLYIWQAIAWQATLDFGAIDSASGISAPHPCAKIGPDPQRMSPEVLLCHLHRSIS